MNKNIKRMFFVTTLILLLVSISAISAADATNDTSSTIQQDVVKEVNVEKVSDNTITDTSTKNIKKEEQTTDLYVSDNSGSDENSGTSTSPYKTIQKALDTTNADSTFNIHIAEGTYKGLGNTNLTVNGNYNINFIGSNDTSIDGEVNYTYHVTQDGDYFWGSSKIWEPYDNGTGNWAMNITPGNGLITISNITIKNCWNPGGSHISLYNTSTIDNYGNLKVDNVNFTFNHGGVGASIRNNNGATVVINNSIFTGNRKSSTTGNYGAGLYNNGTATIINSLFDGNYARWGTVTNDENLTMINTTIKNGINYDGGSTYVTGSGLTLNTSGTDFFDDGITSKTLSVYIDGCTFIDNEGQPSIGYRNATIINSYFTDPLLGADNSRIINNTFSSVFIRSNCIFMNNTMIVDSTYNRLIEIGSNNTITGNNLSSTIVVQRNNGNNSISNNTIRALNNPYTVNLNNTSGNTVTDNYLESIGLTGDDSVYTRNSDNTIVNNTPKLTVIYVNDDNFNTFFNKSGLKYPDIESIVINGSLVNRNITLNINHNITISQANNNFFSYNTTVNINGETKATITNLLINNTNNMPTIILESNDNNINRCVLQTNNEYTITVTTQGNVITNNTLIADLLVGDYSVDAGENNNLNNNLPTYTNLILTQESYDKYFDTEGVFNATEISDDIHLLVSGAVTDKTMTFTQDKITVLPYDKTGILYNTTITAKDTNELYINNITINNTNGKPALNLSIHNATIQNNQIYTNDTAIIIHDIDNRYQDITDIKSKFNLTNNNINIETTNAIAIILNNLHSYTSYDCISLNENNISIKGDNITAIGQYNSTGTLINQNTITATGNNVIGMNLTNTELSEPSLMLGRYIIFKTTSLYRNNVIIESNNNSIGLITENKNIYLSSLSMFNITSNNTATGLQLTNTRNFSSSALGQSIQAQNLKIIINSQNMATAAIINSTLPLTFDKMNFTVTSDKTNGFIIENSSSTLIRGTLNLTGNNNTALNIKNSQKIMLLSSTINDNDNNNENSLIYIENSTNNLIKTNNINSKTKYSIYLTNSQENNIFNNTLYAKEYTGNKAVYTDNNENFIKYNNPTEESESATTDNYKISDSNYYTYFNDDGTLKDEIPENTTFEQVGDITNKNMIINKKINFIQLEQNTIYNTTITLNSDNITLYNIKIDNTNKNVLKINSNNNKILSSQIVLNQDITNLDPIIINGDNNTLTASMSVYSNNSISNNITGIIINGNMNKLSGVIMGYEIYSPLQNYTIVLLNNSNYNEINYVNSFNIIQLINSNYNKLNVTTTLSLYNSKNNQITGRFRNNDYGIFLNDNSNNNFIYTSVINKDILLNNSNNNIITYSNLTLSNSLNIINSKGNEFLTNNITARELEYAIIIENGTENIIHYNALSSKNYKGDETISYSGENIVENNYYQKGRGTASNPYTPLKTVINTNDLLGKPGSILPLEINLFARNRSVTSQPTLPVEEGIIKVKTHNQTQIFNANNKITVNYTITNDTNQIIIIDYLDDNFRYEPRSEIITVSTNILTDDNYNDYFINNMYVGPSSIILGSDLYNKDMIFNNAMNLYNPYNYTIYNGTLDCRNVINMGHVIFNNLILNNTFDKETSIYLQNSILYDSTLILYGNNKNLINSYSGIINNTNIYVYGDNNDVILHDSAQIQTPFASSAIQILNSNITVIGNDNSIVNNYGSIYLQYNNINITGNNSKAYILKYNNVMSTINVQYNNITINGNNDLAVYGEEFWSNSGGITYNNINMNGSNNTAIYYKDTSSVWLENSNITINTDTQQPAIILDNTKATITNNQIIANTQETPLIISNGTIVSVTNNYLESIDLKGDNTVMGATTVNSNTPTDTGFKSNINITTETIAQYTQNTINIIVTDAFGETITGILTATANGKEIPVTDNIIEYTPTSTEEVEIIVTYTDPTGKYNTTSATKTITITPAAITVDPITATAGQTINITARITADNETITDINKGKVTFKVNGKTLKDEKGKVIYAKVVNGTATIENYEVPSDWAKEGTTIQAVYSGSTQCEKLTSEKTEITIQKAVPTLTTEDITATTGGKITLKATITDNDKIINTGKIVFKINGKTVKDENGKVIYAKVVNNTVEFEYTLPESYKAGTYNITATFISADYDRLTDSKTLTVSA